MEDRLEAIEKEARAELLRFFPLEEMTAEKAEWMADQMREIGLKYKCEWETKEKCR